MVLLLFVTSGSYMVRVYDCTGRRRSRPVLRFCPRLP